MIKKILLGLVLLLVLAVLWFYLVGKGYFGGPWQSAPVADGPRTGIQQHGMGEGESGQILFGDLHSHTNYSLDAYLFNTNAVKGGGVVTPADACDFARYCSALDFWSINDHAESLSPRVWADTVASIRDCNARSGDPAAPDMVSFVGWEWSNGNKKEVENHFGHKNVIFRTWEEGMTPTRPISSAEDYIFNRVPAALFGLLSFSDGIADASDLGWYLDETGSVPICPDDVPATDLPDDCREVALTPLRLYQKLDEWGFDSLVIPHGLSWGTTNPLTADFRDQLDQHEQRYQKLLEIYSGHGTSEVFEDFQRIGVDDNGQRYCPEATENFTPCCRQAGVIVRQRCEEPDSAGCDEQVAQTVAAFLEKGAPAGRKVVDDATLDDWAGCGQLQNTFQPASMYVPRLSAQYSLALGFDENGQPKRAKFGIIGSSDNHQARPGNSYKESNRVLYTDNKDVGASFGMSALQADGESRGFYYTGGLVAVHAGGRDRDSIWRGLDSRNVYATSGDRMLVWFDLLNGPAGETPMGSEVIQQDNPRFRVKALGAFKQKPGCPENVKQTLGAERVQFLCGGECYHPSDERKAITRIEIVRIQPQQQAEEAIQPLIEDRWRSFECPADGAGCEVEFEDADYATSGRSALYYARVIQEKELLISGDPFGCEYDEQGNCIKRTYCIGKNATRDKQCLGEAEPRAWSSPIFVEYPL